MTVLCNMACSRLARRQARPQQELACGGFPDLMGIRVCLVEAAGRERTQGSANGPVFSPPVLAHQRRPSPIYFELLIQVKMGSTVRKRFGLLLKQSGKDFNPRDCESKALEGLIEEAGRCR